jgi:5-methyltetrahydrofolate--homocysteine methyltransferase
MIGVMGGDVLMGHDAHCAAWIRKFREPAAEGEGAGGRRGARENRRRGGGGGGAAGGGTEGVQAAAEPTAQVVNG